MQQKLSPENYVKTKARNLPIGDCYINKDWKESGLASIFVSRKHSNGNVTLGIYLVDTYARGTKDTLFKFNIIHSEFEAIIKREHGAELILIEYVLAHNIIYGANAYAEEHGFKVNKAFNLTQYILEEDTEDIALIEIEFGKDGKPLYIGDMI